MRKPLLNVATAPGALAATALAGEVVLRLFFSDSLRVRHGESTLLHRHDPRLGWSGIPFSAKALTGMRTITVRNDSRGFRNPEPSSLGRPAILFLGDSFVWGYDVEQEERFTDRLRERLPGFEIVNLGVCGYATNQEFLLLQEQIGLHEPALVFLLYRSRNDRADNSTNVSERICFKPCFVSENGALRLGGVPVIRTISCNAAAHPVLFRSAIVRAGARVLFRLSRPGSLTLPDPTRDLLEEIRRLAEAHGARFAVGLEGPDEDLARHRGKTGVPWVLLDMPLRYAGKGDHWTPEGHDEVAGRIQAFLLHEGLLAPAASAGPSPPAGAEPGTGGRPRG